MTVVMYTKLTSFVVPHCIHPVVVQNFPKDDSKLDQAARSTAFLVACLDLLPLEHKSVVQNPWVFIPPMIRLSPDHGTTLSGE